VLDKAKRHCELEGMRRFARRAGLDPANLNRALRGRTKPNPSMLVKLRAFLAEES
jgi:transcriptional regulator with XRE-family HTH domain